MKDNYRNYEIVSKNPVAYFMHWDGYVKKVTIIGCDFDKRVTFTYEDGTTENYKWGYLYNTEQDAMDAVVGYQDYLSNDSWDLDVPDCINPWKLLISSKDYSMYKKLKRKEDNSCTSWYVSVNDQNYYDSKHFTRLSDALNYFGNLDEKTIDNAVLGEHNTDIGNLIEMENDTVFVIEPHKFHGKKGRMLKSRHLGKADTYKQWRK